MTKTKVKRVMKPEMNSLTRHEYMRLGLGLELGPRVWVRVRVEG